jgi:predicted metal-dependent phosphoesterase TrpH
LIDLHLHTTASDGRCEPTELVRRAWGAGIHILSVVDHDTVAALSETASIAAAYGIESVPGIEITAVWGDRDVHVLGYFFDPGSAVLTAFLMDQRADRVCRVRDMAAKLEELGKPIDVERLTRPSAAKPGRSIGRPLVAWALVRAGHVSDVRQAFDELIGEGRPAYVARRGTTPADVLDIIRQAGGVASLAHPGLLGHDELIPELAQRGLTAIEAYHSDHDPAGTAHYLAVAMQYGLAVSGGSDYHGDAGHRRDGLGVIELPEEHYRVLVAKVKSRGSAR